MVRVKTASTHPALLALLKSCFGKHGPSYVNARKSSISGFEWAFTFDLDASFSFLLGSPVAIPGFVKGKLFLAYLAGFFDAEGSIFVNSNGWFELSMTNSDRELLSAIESRLRNLGIHSKIVRTGSTALSSDSEVWQLRVWRRADVIRLLEELPLRHPEKVAKKRIVEQAYTRNGSNALSELLSDWEHLLDSIKQERDGFVREAQNASSRKKRGDAGDSTIGPLPQANNSPTNISRVCLRCGRSSAGAATQRGS